MLNEITHYTKEDRWHNGLKTAEEISQTVHVPANTIFEWAVSGSLPHWRINAGEPLFKVSEVQKWIIENNIMERCNGNPVPINLRISTIAPDADMIHVPTALQEIKQLKKIPHDDYAPCVYFLCEKDEIVYIGQSVRVANRLASHVETKNFESVFVIHLPRISLDFVESALIRHFQPKLNGQSGRDGLSTPVISTHRDKEALKLVGLC